MSAHIATGVVVQEAERLIAEVPRWDQAFEVVPGVTTPGADDPLPLLRRLELSPRLDGLHALAVGCGDGFFAFEMERRGARVSAAPLGEPTEGFLAAHRLRRSRVEALPGPVYDLGRHDAGPFDLVLCLGVLERLRHPLLALDVLGGMLRSGGMLLVETRVVGNGPAGPDRPPVMEYRPGPILGGAWTPTIGCLEQMVASARFLVRGAGMWSGDRAIVRAVRMRPPAMPGQARAGLRLVGAADAAPG